MSISFSPKEAIAFIAKSIVLASAAASGVPLDHAELAGGVLEGTIKGFSYTPTEKSIHQKLSHTIRQSIQSVLQAPDYEIPEDCINPLMEAFSFDSAIEYLKSSDPLSRIKVAIQKTCSISSSCDIATLPIDQIAENLLRQIYWSIYNNHELSALITLVQTGEINRKLDSLILLLHSTPADNHSREDTNEQIKQSSFESAQKYATAFQSLLFSEQEFSDSLRLCDVYVDSCIIDNAGTKYTSLMDVLYAYHNEETILLEGEAGSGKSSLLMKIADQYLRRDGFLDRNFFFVQGKEIRNSKGNPIEDILRVLKLHSAESLVNSIVFLDAYDEISYAAASPEKNQEYVRKLVYDSEGITLIITARKNYIRAFNGLRFQLEGFDPEQRKHFLTNYNSHRNSENKLSKEFIDSLTQADDCYEDGIFEILSIPMLLYMIAIRNIDISEIKDKFDLYEFVFTTDGRGAMHSRGKDQKVISKKIWSDSYALALSIAKSMFFRNDSFISEDHIRSYINEMDIPKATKDILKNRFGIEIFLSGGDSSIYTFVHRSIYEYFTAKGICVALKDIINQYLHNSMDISDVISALNNVFPADYYSESVFYYVMFAINRGYVIETLSKEENIYRIESMFHQLLASQLCISRNSSIPYLIRLKNLLLWVFNTFSVMFGMHEIDENAHWVKIDHSILQYILRIKEPEDTLMISHCDLRNISLYKYDLGSVYFIDNDLTGAVLKEATCTQIISSGQLFHFMNIRSADFWNGDYSGFSFDHSDLRYSDFRDSILHGASFRGADLRCCLFANAEMYGADFTNAHIYLEDFDNALCDDNAFEKAIIHDSETDDPEEDILG